MIGTNGLITPVHLLIYNNALVLLNRPKCIKKILIKVTVANFLKVLAWTNL